MATTFIPVLWLLLLEVFLLAIKILLIRRTVKEHRNSCKIIQTKRCKQEKRGENLKEKTRTKKLKKIKYPIKLNEKKQTKNNNRNSRIVDNLS